MKKALFTLAFLSGLAGTAQAQRNVSLGLKAGATYASFVGDDAGNVDGLFGFHAGVFANIGVTELFAFQPELLYSQKGGTISTTDVDRRLNYLDVPLAFHLNTQGLFFEAGPQVGLLLAAHDERGSVSVDQKRFYNDFDFGYLVGLGYQRKQGPGIGLRYNGGFTNVDKAQTGGGVNVQAQARNSAFQLYLTYSFNRR